MKKIAATAIAGAMLAAVPAIAQEGHEGAHAAATDGFLTVGGPKRLEPKATLRVPIRCSVDCSTTTRTKLHLPDTEIPPSVADGQLAAGKPRNLIVRLNDAATETIRTQSQASRLRVGVTAISEATDERVRLVKVFRFLSPD